MKKETLFSNFYNVSGEIVCFDCLSEDNKNEVVTEDDIVITIIGATQISYNYAMKKEYVCSICSNEPKESNSNTNNELEEIDNIKEEKLTAKDKKVIKKAAEKIANKVTLTIEDFVVTEEMKEKFTEEQIKELENLYYKKIEDSNKKEVVETIISNNKDLDLKVELKEIYVQRGPRTIAKIVSKERKSWRDIMDL